MLNLEIIFIMLLQMKFVSQFLLDVSNEKYVVARRISKPYYMVLLKTCSTCWSYTGNSGIPAA